MTQVRPAAPALRRELGRWDLSAIGINQVIGGAVFAMPASLAAATGAWSPWLVLAIGLASMLIAATFAEVGSRFEGTGGSYLYTRAAFGRFAAFEVGWMQWFTRVASWASVLNVLVDSLGFYWPELRVGADRLVLMTLIVAALAAINIAGIQQSAWTVNALTLGKLVPLVLFVAAGLFVMNPGALRPSSALTFAQASAPALLLIYAFGGYEVIPVPAGEARDPVRAVPFALLTTLAVVAVLFTLAQVVVLGTLPGVAASKTPLADAAARFAGAAGALLITAGAVVATLGNNMGSALSGSRNLYALAEQGDLPALFGRVHPRLRTPIVAILITAATSLVLAVSGTFVSMAQASAISRLVIYVATCASALALRRQVFAAVVRPAAFRLPLGPVIPVAAIVVSLAILAGATPVQKRAGLATLAVGAIFFFVAGGRPRQ